MPLSPFPNKHVDGIFFYYPGYKGQTKGIIWYSSHVISVSPSIQMAVVPPLLVPLSCGFFKCSILDGGGGEIWQNKTVQKRPRDLNRL